LALALVRQGLRGLIILCSFNCSFNLNAGFLAFSFFTPPVRLCGGKSNAFMKKKVTIQDIARKANVSKSTVSRVLNKTTPVEERKAAAVEAAMKQLNFRPNAFARGLAGGQSMTIGVVTQNIGSPFYDAVTQGVISALSATEYSPIFVDGQWNKEIEATSIRTLLNRQVDGLILIGGNLPANELKKLVESKPLVLVAQRLEGFEKNCLSVDNVEAGLKATQFLLDLGHREIAHIAGIPEHEDAIQRLDGYRTALQNAGITPNPKLLVDGNFSSQSGVLAVESLLARGVSFSAIFAANDEMACGARLALYRRGIRVPEDVSLIGFDNQPASAFMTPPLTTVAQPSRDMGSAAAQIILQQIAGEEFQAPNFPVEIVVRESAIRRW
jgi:LacI family transcriptional regulator